MLIMYKLARVMTPANSILLLCDGYSSNSSRANLFKQDLQALVNQLGIEIRVAHYPPNTSKYNSIEDCLFPHLSRVCQGVIFDSVEIVKDLMSKAKTRTGLKVLATTLE
jgi:Rhodopirellula transposase DDE domain